MVELYNVFYTDQRVSIVMELMDGGSLQDHLDDVLAEREEEQRQQRKQHHHQQHQQYQEHQANNFSFATQARHSFNALTSPLHSGGEKRGGSGSGSCYDLPTLKNITRQVLRGLALLHRQHR